MTQAAAAQLASQNVPSERAVVETTLLELVQTVGELTDDDREVVATVSELLKSGHVRLIGSFRGKRIALA
jgi:hypothetical protein